MAKENQEVVEVQYSNEEVQESVRNSSKEVKYSDDGAKGLDGFLSDVVGPDYASKVQTSKDKNEKTPSNEEEKTEEREIDPKTEKRIEDLLSKSESDGLTDNEISFLKEHGYEIEEEISEENNEDSEENELEEEVEEQLEPFSLPKEFVSEIDDFFSDDEEYNPGEATTEDRLSRATIAIRKMRENQSRLRNILADSPELASIISDLDKGDSLDNAIRKHLGSVLEEEPPKAGTPEYDKWVIQKEDAKRERKRVEDFQKQRTENFRKSGEEAISFVKENNWNKKQTDAFTEKLDKHFQDIAKGIITKEFMTIVKNGLNYKKDIEMAEKAGEVRMANKRIKMKKRMGDGLPKIKSKKEEIKSVTYDSENTERFHNFLEG